MRQRRRVTPARRRSGVGGCCLAITYTESWWLEECAKAEEEAARKYLAYSELATDVELKRVCDDLASMHRHHLDMLASAVTTMM